MRKISLAIGLLILTLGIVFYQNPKNIAEDRSLLEIRRVVSYTDGIETDLTDHIDIDALAQIISEYQHSRISRVFSPYKLSDIRYEISCSYDDKSIYILLGDLNIIYDSRDNGGFPIIDSEKMLREIDMLIRK